MNKEVIEDFFKKNISIKNLTDSTIKKHRKYYDKIDKTLITIDKEDAQCQNEDQ
jgi:hypothetical protein